MSYFDRLEGFKQGLMQKADEYQQLQDNIQQGAEDFLNAKVNDLAEKLEAVGGLGLGTIEAGKAVKKLYNKWRGKKDEEDDEEEGDGETTTTTTDTTTAQQAQQQQQQEQGQQNEEQRTAEQGEDAEDAEGPSENLESVADNLPEAGAEVEMQDLGATAQLTRPSPANNYMPENAIQETQAQQDIMNQDPEAGTDNSPQRIQPEEEAVEQTGEDVAETGVDVSTTASSTLLDTGLAIGDAVLDAVPVIGEVAMVATAIAGFFESMFGHHHTGTPAPDEIIAQAGFDPSSVISQLPVSLQV
jgi:hypothetical protein